MTSSSAFLEDTQAKPELISALAPDNARRRFVINVASNLAYTLANVVAYMWFTPFLIAHLGIAVYGLVPLVNSVTSYMMLFTGGLDTAISRFLTIDLNRGDEAAANRTFNTALCGLITIAIVLLPLGLAGAWLFPTLFQVPPGLENEARLLFGLSALAFLLTIIGSSFTVSAFAYHRFDLSNLVLGMRLAAQVGTVVLLFKLLSGRLWYVGFGILAAAIVSLAGYWLLWRRLAPQLHFRPSKFDRARLGELANMGGWTVVNQVGLLLCLNIGLIVVNTFFGAETTGRYGTILLFPTLLETLGNAASVVLNPAILARYALQDFEGMRKLVSQAVKLMGIAVALPVGLLCGFSRPLLRIWLGPDFQSLDILLIILVGHLSINMATLPLRYVFTSYNKVRLQGIFTVILGVANLGLAITLARWGVWGAVGVAIATTTVWTARNLFFISGYSAHVMNLRWWAFYPSLVTSAVDTLVVGLGSYGLTQIWWPQNWLGLGGMAIAVSLGYGILAYFVNLNREDRQLLFSLIQEPIRKYLYR